MVSWAMEAPASLQASLSLAREGREVGWAAPSRAPCLTDLGLELFVKRSLGCDADQACSIFLEHSGKTPIRERRAIMYENFQKRGSRQDGHPCGKNGA